MLSTSSSSYINGKNSDLGQATAEMLPKTLPRLQSCLRAWADPLLLFTIVLSVLLVVLSTVELLKAYHRAFDMALHSFVWLFAVEFVMRLRFAQDKRAYLLSIFGVIDMLSCIPVLATEMARLCLPMQIKHDPCYLDIAIMLQLLRTFRIFRVLRLDRCVKESHEMMFALESPRSLVFMFGLFIVSLLLSAVMYSIEGQSGQGKLSSIPRCLYWTVVTISTVGYGDVTTSTPLGKAFAIFVITIGYGTIVAPGIHVSDGPILRVLDPKRDINAQSSCGSQDSCRRRDCCREDGGLKNESPSLLVSVKADSMSMTRVERAQLLAFLAERVAKDIRDRPKVWRQASSSSSSGPACECPGHTVPLAKGQVFCRRFPA